MVLKEFFKFRRMVTDFHLKFNPKLIKVDYRDYTIVLNEIKIEELKEEFDSKILAIDEQTEVTLVELVENRYTLDESKVQLYMDGIDNELRALVAFINESIFEGERYDLVCYNPILQSEIDSLFVNNQEIKDYLITVYLKLNNAIRDLLYYSDFLTGDGNEESNSNEGKVLDRNIKIKWNGSPSLLGFLFLELTKQGYIDLPPTNGEGSYSGLAKLVFKYFDIRGRGETQTTEGNMIKEFNPSKNTIGVSTSSKFIIPPFEKK